MPLILITETPPGEAPLEVRQQWVGLILPVAENVPPTRVFEVGVLGGEAIEPGGYPVETVVAIQELEKKSQAAAQWWKENIYPMIMPWLVFQKNYCELIP